MSKEERCVVNDEELGRLVRGVWISWAKENIEKHYATWEISEWDKCDKIDQKSCIAIGRAIAAEVTARALRGLRTFVQELGEITHGERPDSKETLSRLGFIAEIYASPKPRVDGSVVLTQERWAALQEHLIGVRESVEMEAGTETCVHTNNPATINDVSDRKHCHRMCTCEHECGEWHVEINGTVNAAGAWEPFFVMCTHPGCQCTKFVEKV